MKRSGFLKRNTPLKSRSSLKTGGRLRVRGISDSSVLKEEIQALLREIVTLRDGGCWLRHFTESGACGGYRKDGVLILQAEHLETRSNAQSFADHRLVVCICKRHHIYWKPQFSAKYNELAEKFIGPERTKLWKAVRDDRYMSHKVDFQLELLALKQYLAKLKNPR